MADRVVCGKHAVIEALEAGSRIRRLHVAKESHAARDPRLKELLSRSRVAVSESPRSVLDRLSQGTPHQGVIAVLEPFGYLELEDLLDRARKKDPRAVLVALDEITDPHNLGAILRSAEALGAQGALVPERRSSPITPVVEKAAAGATSHLPIAEVRNLSDALEVCKEREFWVIGADAAGEDAAWDFDLNCPLVLVVGSEGKGLRERVKKTCDKLLAIPLSGKIASLNASVAAGVLLYEIARQRKG